MRLILYRHDRRTMLRHAAPPQEALDPRLLAGCGAGAVVLSFRDPGPARSVLTGGIATRRVDATSRFTAPAASELVVVGVETDSRLAPVILWDLFHSAPVGTRFRMVEDHPGPGLFARRYYTGAMVVEERREDGGAVVTVWRKIAPGAVEADAGLDAWTFGIPSGPGDASAINACVKRILELGVPQAEIIVCGQVGPGFRYRDQVRLIGEDLPVTPIRLGEKKNRLASAASHGNLCLLHDRVILPRTFMAAVRVFGDAFPFTTFQSVYFYDRRGLTGQRYADIETLDWRPLGPYERRDDGVPFVQPYITGEERYRQAYGPPACHTGTDYVIGSLYMVKRSAWHLCPQGTDRTWMEWEDIEHGCRAAREWGIPARINPHAITQSLFTRFRTLGCQWLPGEGRVHEHRMGPSWPLVGALLPSRVRKPHIRLSEEAYRDNLRRFAERHVLPAHRAEVEAVLMVQRLDFRGRAAAMHLLLARAAVRRTPAAVDAFIRDVFSLLVGEGAEPPYYWAALRDEIVNGTDPERLRRAPMRHWVVRGPMRWFPLRRMFGASFADHLPLAGDGWGAAAAFLTALYLRLFRRRMVHVPGGVFALARALRASAPDPAPER